MQNAAVVDTRGWTVTRMLGELVCLSASVAGAWGAGKVDIGIGVISREGVTGGVYPDPNAEADEPTRGWLWRTRLVVAQNGIGTPVISVPNSSTPCAPFATTSWISVSIHRVLRAT